MASDDAKAKPGWKEYVEWCRGLRMRIKVRMVRMTSGMRAKPMRVQKLYLDGIVNDVHRTRRIWVELTAPRSSRGGSYTVHFPTTF